LLAKRPFLFLLAFWEESYPININNYKKTKEKKKKTVCKLFVVVVVATMFCLQCPPLGWKMSLKNA
jgi:hypothetical protein